LGKSSDQRAAGCIFSITRLALSKLQDVTSIPVLLAEFPSGLNFHDKEILTGIIYLEFTGT
jgi:hypothetical protein